MRLFIAIQLSDGIRKGLSSVQAYLRGHGVRGNYTKIENLHLTLAFISVEIPDVSMQVMSVSLMRSDRTKSGMVYTEVG